MSVLNTGIAAKIAVRTLTLTLTLNLNLNPLPMRAYQLSSSIPSNISISILLSQPSGTVVRQFDHEKLKVYQTAITFVVWSSDLLTDVPKRLAVHNQLDRASTSIPLNIAEGNGKYTSADRCRFFDTARGSALECAACLDVLVAKTVIDEARSVEGKELLFEIVSMLVGLIRSNSANRDV